MFRRMLLVVPAVAVVFALAPAAEPGPVSIKVEDVVFRIGDELVTRYHVGPDVAKPYLWPLNAPGGIPVTRAWPMDKAGAVSTDHVHQKSSWFCHGDVIP